MTSINTKKKFDCDICIGGKRIGTMRQIARDTFKDSFLSIEVKMPDRIFIVRVDNQINKNDLEVFTTRHTLCKVIVYQPIEFALIKNPKR